MHLYIHVPFCARRCSYCDFSIAVRRDVPVRDFVDGIAREISIRSLGGETLETLYCGGGTPSKLGAEGVLRLADVVGNRFTLSSGAEFTIEANPEDVTPASAAAWRRAGVNRLSLGAQSFNAGVLEWMHRTHTVDDVARSVGVARDAGIDNLSLDLIFALPESLERDWRDDLDRALVLAPDHLSVYGLTVERTTPLGRWMARGEVRESPEERWAMEFETAHAVLVQAGFAHYEVSNYAREGRRARHNEAYWLDHAYHGLGPSAHGFDGTRRRWNEPAYARWLARVVSGEDPVAGSELLTPEERIAERVYLGLRTDRGLPLEPDEISSAALWVEQGWGTVNSRHESRSLVLSSSWWMRLDAIATALTALRSRY